MANVAYRKFSESDLEDTIDLFAGIYAKALKGNPYLEKGVLTGVQYIAQSGMLSGLNNLGKFDFTSAKYAQHYGFDQDEVDHFFSHFGVPEELGSKARRWYDGYKVPRYYLNKPMHQPVEIVAKYNVWSIVNYLLYGRDSNFAQFQSYWEQSGNINFMQSLFKQDFVRDIMEKLVNGDSIYLNRKYDFSADDFKALKAMLGGNKEITQNGLTILFSYLFTGGYLTIDGNRENYYCLPNMELKYEMEERLITYYEDIYTVDYAKINKVTDVLQQVMGMDEPNWDNLATLLKDFYDRFREVIRNIQLGNDESVEGVFMNEDIVHSLLNYIALQTQHTTLGSELYTQKINSDDRGRVDLKITCQEVGLILETKCVRTRVGATQHMQDALEQAKSYRNVLSTNNNIFLVVNVAKKASMPAQRSIELLCAADLFGEHHILGINASGEPDIFEGI